MQSIPSIQGVVNRAIRLVDRLNTHALPEVKAALKEAVRRGAASNSEPAAAPASTHWRAVPNELPWFDRPDAEEILGRRLESGELTAEDHAMLTKWVRDGYVIIDGALDPADIDAMVATLDGLWDARQPIEGLTLLSISEKRGGPVRNYTHAELLQLDPDTRQRMRKVSNWRIHGFENLNAAAMNLYQSAKIREAVSKIFHQPAQTIASINFMYGSEQALHQDMAVFHIHPRNYLIGAWIACEDISPDSGPLSFCPGSHRVPLFGGFHDYPQTNLRTVNGALQTQYQAYVDAIAQNFVKKQFIGKRGQVLLWHGMLIHGGSPIQQPELSRKSMVLHYSVEGANRHAEVQGPFNW